MRGIAATLLLAGCDPVAATAARQCGSAGMFSEPYLCPFDQQCAPPPDYCGKPDPNVTECDTKSEYEGCMTDMMQTGVCLTANSGNRTCTQCSVNIAWCAYSGWQPMSLPPELATVNLDSVWVLGRGDAYAGGIEGQVGVLLHYDGMTWSKLPGLPALTNSVSSLWAADSAKIYFAAANDGVFRFDGSCMATDGSCFQHLAPASGASVTSLWGIGPDDIFGVGYGAIQEYRTGTGWSSLATPTATLNATWAIGTTGAEQLVAVGGVSSTSGYTDTCSGMTCMPVQTSSVGLYGVWGTSATNVYAVGSYSSASMSSTVLLYNGSTWTPMTVSGSKTNLAAVWGVNASDAYAVGQNGTILHYNGNMWSPPTDKPTTTPQLTAIAGSSSADIIAVGKSGTIWRYSE